MLYAYVLLGAGIGWFVFELLGVVTPKKLSSIAVEKWLEENMVQKLQNNKKTGAVLSRIEKLLAKSNFRYRNRPIKLIYFLIFEAFLFLAGFYISFQLLKNFVAAVLIGTALVMISYQLLVWDAKRVQKKIKSQMLNFLLSVSNLYGVYEDPVRALQELLGNLKNPLRRDIGWFLDNLQYDMPLRYCIDAVKLRIGNSIFHEFLDQLELYMTYGGNFQETIIDLVEKTYQMENKEAQKSSYIWPTVLVCVILTVIYFVILFSLVKNQPKMMYFLTNVPTGKMIVVTMIVIFIFVGYIIKSAAGGGEEL